MDSLQFQKADFAGSSQPCSLCKGAIDKTYYHLNGVVICPACAAQTEAAQQRPAHTWVMQGFLYGLGAAILCAIGYSIFTYATNMEFGLIAIGVGYVVGSAVRKGSRGLGGRRCQIAAVFLTYLAITTSYLPALIKGAAEASKKDASKKEAAAGSKQAAEAPVGVSTPQGKESKSIAVDSAQRPSVFEFLLGVAILCGVALIIPFLGLASGFGGIIGLVIIFFGLQQAWKQTARDSRMLMGPYEVGEQTVG